MSGIKVASGELVKDKAGAASVSCSGVAPGYDDYKPSKLYWHEALDRSSLACDFFHENVAEHPAVQSDVELKNIAEKLVEVMADFYQRVGHKSCEFDELETES